MKGSRSGIRVKNWTPLPFALRLPRRALMQHAVEPSDLLRGERETIETAAPKRNKRANKTNPCGHAPLEKKNRAV